MAARVLLQRRAFAPFAAAALGGLALAPGTVLAEAPSDKRKPIYDVVDSPSTYPAPPSAPKALPNDHDEDSWLPKGPSPTDRLAVQIGKARLFLYDCAVTAEDKVNQAMDSAFNLEQSFTKTIASLGPSRESGEKLMPGTIYVLVAAMAGSIITRNRNILFRATLPLALGVGAGWTVLPITMRNVSDLAWKYEQRFPALAESHIKVRESIKQGISFAKVHKQVSVQYVDDKVTDAREIIEGWVKQGK